MKTKGSPQKIKALTLVLVVIPIIAIAQSAGDRAEQKRVNEGNHSTSQDEAARQKEIVAEAVQYRTTMRYANWLEQATNSVPSPSTFSALYLKELGEFKVSCETNRRSGTINYRVDGCQTTNINAVFASLRQLPNRVRISQGTNFVTVAIRLPTQ